MPSSNNDNDFLKELFQEQSKEIREQGLKSEVQYKDLLTRIYQLELRLEQLWRQDLATMQMRLEAHDRLFTTLKWVMSSGGLVGVLAIVKDFLPKHFPF